jgi:hypothetical protein
MRTAALVGAAEFTKGRLDAGVDGHSRQAIDAVLQRADEPGEMLGYWTSKYGRKLPKPVKRGIADAVQRLYNERSLLKYDTDSKGYRFGDVIDLVHPTPDAAKRWQGDLFQHALDRRHNRDNDIPATLAMLIERDKLMGLPVDQRRQVLARADVREVLTHAGVTWEALAGWLQGPMDADAWSAVIPSMGYMALIRNLRNFDEAGVSDEVAGQIIAKLVDPEQVARSRQLPFRFYSAYINAPSLRWGHALDKALTLATGNVPAFKGRTLVLVDTSGSMTGSRISGRSSVTPAQAAALFGAVLASKGGADLYGFADGVFKHDIGKGASVLKKLERFVARTGEVGHGTQIAESVRRTYDGHDRVIILSDMQTMGGYYAGNVTDAAPKNIPMYGFNLVGYQHAAMPTGSGNRHELGGFSDSTFKLIPLLEAGTSADWPF